MNQSIVRNSFIAMALIAFATAATGCMVSSEPELPTASSAEAALSAKIGEGLPLPSLDLKAIEAQHSLSSGGATTNGPAPALTQLYVAAVGSTNALCPGFAGPWEYMTSINQFSTVCNHGGTQLWVVTLEVGIGAYSITTFNGAVLPFSANFFTVNLCWNFSGQLVECQNGQIIAGYERYWDVSGNENGRFTYQSTSVNFPSNTISTAINIL